MGSISGDVIAGAPGIGGPPIRPQNTSATTGGSNPNSYTESTRSDGATITGGIYPNGLDTTWWIQYWPANGSGSVQQTPASDIGSGTSPVMVTGYPTHLASSTTYDYELVAQNSDGTTDGYTYSFTTGSQSTTAPVAAFTSSPAPSTPGSAVSFNASGSSRCDGASIIDYSWNFGDGSAIDRQRCATQTASAHLHQPGHLQRHADRHQHQRRERDDHPDRHGRLDSDRVLQCPEQPTPGTATTFDASASTDSVGTITNYSWNFGDGNTDPTESTADRHPYLRHAWDTTRSR